MNLISIFATLWGVMSVTFMYESWEQGNKKRAFQWAWNVLVALIVVFNTAGYYD